MPRWLLFLVFIIVQVYRGMVFLKNELIMSVVYFTGLAPAALARRLSPPRERRMLARGSSWVEIEDKETDR